MGRCVGVHGDSRSRECRRDLLQQFQPFAGHLRLEILKASDVAIGRLIQRDDDFEAWITLRVREALPLPAYFFPSLTEYEIAADDFPRRTLFRLNHAARFNFSAALTCLLDPATAFGAFTLTRPLIEAWLHVRHIYGDGVDGADRRALALEHGIAR